MLDSNCVQTKKFLENLEFRLKNLYIEICTLVITKCSFNILTSAKYDLVVAIVSYTGVKPFLYPYHSLVSKPKTQGSHCLPSRFVMSQCLRILPIDLKYYHVNHYLLDVSLYFHVYTLNKQKSYIRYISILTMCD